MQDFSTGWALPHSASVDSFRRSLINAGFASVEFHDLSPLIAPSVGRIYLHRLSNVAVQYDPVLFGFPRRDYAARYQRILFEQRRLLYGVFTADKT